MKIPYQYDFSRKKGAINVDSNLFPIPTLGGSEIAAISGSHVMVAHVSQFGDLLVRNPKHAHAIYHNGCFGSGALSLRGHNFSKASKLITRRQFERRKDWSKLVPRGQLNGSNKVYVVDEGPQVDQNPLTNSNRTPDSNSQLVSGSKHSIKNLKSSADTSSSAFFTTASESFSPDSNPGNRSVSKLNSIPSGSKSEAPFTSSVAPPTLERDPFPLSEPLILLGEETMFLCLLGCLAVSKTTHHQLDKEPLASRDKIKEDAKQEEYMTIDELWKFLNARDNFFMYKFAVYYMLRMNKWVVKEGYNYGAEYALYPHPGPAACHSTHLVKMQICDLSNLGASETLMMDLNSGDRVAGNVKKDLVIAVVLKPITLREPWSVWHCLENLRVELMPCRRLELSNLTVVKD